MKTFRLIFYLCSSAFLCGCASPAWAQCPARTTVAETIYNADGTLAEGRVVIAWQTFSIGACQVAAGQATVTVVAGALSVQLYPNTTAVPSGASYRATYYLKSGRVTTEYWVVPASATPVGLAAVRSATVPVPNVMFSQSQVTNLGADLAKKVELPSPCVAGKFLQSNGSAAPPQVNCVDGAGGGGGSGTVTSVGLSAPTHFSITGSPITSSGTLSLGWVNQAANVILAGPASGGAAAPGFRALVAADIPSLDAAKISSGSFADARVDDTITLANLNQITTRNYTDLQNIPTTFAPATHAMDGAAHSASGLTAGHFLKALTATTFGFAQISFSELSGSVTDAQVPNTITIDLAAAATALAANGGNCSAGSAAAGVDAAGAAESCTAFLRIAGDTLTGTLVARAGATGAGTAPIKFQAGVLMTAPEAHAFEWDGTDLHITTSAAARAALSKAGHAHAAADVTSGALTVARGGAGAAPGGDDQVLVSDSTSAATWRTIPDCDTAVTSKLLYDQATNTWSCGTDQTGGHNILSATHADSTAAAVARGAMLVGVGATPKWERVTIGLANRVWASDGTDPAWTALADAHIPNNITIDLAAAATALAANGGNCANQFPRGVDASGAAEGCASVAKTDVGATIVTEDTTVTRDFPLSCTHPRVKSLAGNAFFDVEGLTTGDFDQQVAKFADAVDGRIVCSAFVPNELAATPAAKIIFDVQPHAACGASQNFRVNLRYRFWGSGSADTALTAETAQDLSGSTTAHSLTRGTFPSSGSLASAPAAGHNAVVELQRDGGHANDTCAQVLEIIPGSVKLRVDVKVKN